MQTTALTVLMDQLEMWIVAAELELEVAKLAVQFNQRWLCSVDGISLAIILNGSPNSRKVIWCTMALG
jgi:hypothetical protein